MELSLLDNVQQRQTVGSIVERWNFAVPIDMKSGDELLVTYSPWRLIMKSKGFIATLFALGLLVSCAHIDPHPMDMASAVRNARTSADHNALARHYEDTAKRMQAKAQMQKNMMIEYTRHGYYYGRQTKDLQEHTEALARVYEEAAEANRNMAKFHHRLAEDASQ